MEHGMEQGIVMVRVPVIRDGMGTIVPLIHPMTVVRDMEYGKTPVVAVVAFVPVDGQEMIVLKNLKFVVNIAQIIV
jgi:hypothetical protein